MESIARQPESSHLLAAALEAARRGWRVVPAHTPRDGRCSCGTPDCADAGKHPRIAAWPGAATTGRPQIHAWWTRWPDANVAVVTGAGSGFWVLDVDPRNGGDDALAKLQREHGPLPETVEAITGSGGRHLYFLHPGPEVRIPNSAGKLGPGLDVRGDGGCVLLPPSRHASGGRYVWEVAHGPDLAPLAPDPAWLRRGAIEAARQGASPVPERIHEGKRNDTLHSQAGRMRRAGLSADEMLPTLLEVNQVRCVPPLPEAEVKRIAKSAATHPAGQISLRPEPGVDIKELTPERVDQGDRTTVDIEPSAEPVVTAPPDKKTEAPTGRASPWDAAKPAPEYIESAAEMRDFLDLERRFFCPGLITEIYAPLGIGKTMVMIYYAVQLCRAGLRGLIINRDNPKSILTQALRAFGAAETPTLKIIGREHAPPLTNRPAWRAFPYAD
jgi:Bifunctional DNA primase/polymerase, N-terminal/Primase C terminal 1 (PriCT-1)